MHAYRLSAAGRRTNLLMLIASLLILGFAIWMLRVALGPSNPGIGTTYTMSQLAPAALLGLLIIATPIVIWGILCEWAAIYTLDERGLHIATLGAQQLYPWDAIHGTRPHPNGRDGAVVVDAAAAQGALNPVARWLFYQTFGRRTVRIPAELEHGDELLERVHARVGDATNGQKVAQG